MIDTQNIGSVSLKIVDRCRSKPHPRLTPGQVLQVIQGVSWLKAKEALKIREEHIYNLGRAQSIAVTLEAIGAPITPSQTCCVELTGLTEEQLVGIFQEYVALHEETEKPVQESLPDDNSATAEVFPTEKCLAFKAHRKGKAAKRLENTIARALSNLEVTYSLEYPGEDLASTIKVEVWGEPEVIKIAQEAIRRALKGVARLTEVDVI